MAAASLVKTRRMVIVALSIITVEIRRLSAVPGVRRDLVLVLSL